MNLDFFSGVNWKMVAQVTIVLFLLIVFWGTGVVLPLLRERRLYVASRKKANERVTEVTLGGCGGCKRSERSFLFSASEGIIRVRACKRHADPHPRRRKRLVKRILRQTGVQVQGVEAA
jgi:hypothetical protein